LDLTGGVANQKKKKPTEGADLFKILKMIMEKKFSPVIIFSFSKKEVEGYAMAMLKFDLTTEDEKDKIGTIFESAIDCLSEEDRNLP
jgi:ATP-dependent RNA helicase DOB1